MLKVTLICLSLALTQATLLGGWSKVSNDDSDVMEVMNFVETSLNARINSMYYNKATKVIDVQRQLVNGLNYKIAFELTPTKCIKNRAQDLAGCEVNDQSIVQTCKVKVYEDFSKGRTLNEFHCSAKMAKRAGEIEKVDDPSKYRDVAIRAFAMSNSALKNVRVISATTQVVAGELIRMKVLADGDVKDVPCEVHVWSRPWLKDDAFKVEKFSCAKMMTRELLGGVTGGISDDLDNKQAFLPTAKKALAMTNSALEDITIVRARTQVVAGQNIFLTVTGKELGQAKQCDMTIWTRPWVSGPEGFKLTHFSCMKATERMAKRAGGIQKVDDPSIYTDFAIKAFAMSNSAAVKNVRVISATTQVVAGQMIRMKVLADGDVKDVLCEVDVWSRPWLKDDAFKVTKFSCSSKMIGKRACLGCISEPVDDPDKYMGLYIKAYGLARTNMDINNIQILSVKTQVVSGIKYYMKVKTSEAGKPRICDVQFVEQAWMTPSIKSVNFDCKPTQ